MTPQGPRPPGDEPDPDGTPDRDDRAEDGADATAAGSGQRGWLHPDDRLWRHPSEVWSLLGTPSPAGGAGQGTRGAHERRLRSSSIRRRSATVLVGSAAATAVAVGVLLLVGASGSSVPLTASTDSTSSTAVSVVAGCCRVLPAVERDASDAMVSLRIATSGGVGQGCGVVVAAGGLVATTLDAVAGAQSITAVTSRGKRLAASLVATDRASDLALVRVSAELPVARFAGIAQRETGHRAIVMALTTGAGMNATGPTMTVWTSGTIRSVDTTVSKGSATGMAGIEAATASRPAMAGEALLDPAGRVLGILDSSGNHSVHGASKVFLPAQLVVGVANRLAAAGHVDHGWLDIEGADAPAPSFTTTTSETDLSSAPSPEPSTGRERSVRGAVVEAVEPNGASTGVLRPGEVIRSVDGQPVRSMAELRNRLYVLPPGARVVLGISSQGSAGRSIRPVAVDLSGSP